MKKRSFRPSMRTGAPFVHWSRAYTRFRVRGGKVFCINPDCEEQIGTLQDVVSSLRSGESILDVFGVEGPVDDE